MWKSPSHFVHWMVALLLAGWCGFAVGQPYGLDQREAVGPFLNGALPPALPTSTNWQVVDAFPNLRFTNLTALVAEPGTTRLFVLEREGRIHHLENHPATANATLFLDLSTNTLVVEDSGLLGLAFHPEYGVLGSSNRNYIYVWYQFIPQPVAFPQLTTIGYNRLSRFTVPDGSPTADRNSELVLINQLDHHTWHNGGGMFFGPDGFLYVPNGDEGGANDQYNQSQKIDGGLFGGVLRIDVDMDPTRSHPIRRQPQSGTIGGSPPAGWPGSYSSNYFIPNDNPWLNTNGTVLEEFYCIGLRSPHRITYDPPTGRIWCGDIGQNTREEVDVIEKGANYQWAYREGSIGGAKTQPNPLIGVDTPPVYDYGRSEGNCVIGGYVYRGAALPELQGKYIFGDNGSGKLWAMDYDGVNPPTVTYLANMPAGELYTGLSSFGLDQSGELFMCKMGDNEKIYRLVSGAGVGSPPPALLSQTGVFTNLLTLEPAVALVPYDVASPLWSDGALKKRWMAVPNDGAPYGAGEAVAFSTNGNWVWPTGTVFVKHFDLSLNDTNALELKRLETRLLVHGTNGSWYGITYRWWTNQLDADLLASWVEETNFITTASGVRTQVWYYPSRSDCQACHTVNSGQVLGVRTCQMNRDLTYPASGNTDNQLRTLNHLGIFSGFPGESNIVEMPQAVPLNHPTASLEHKVRSYLDSNCAQCHRPNGVRAGFDARFDTPLPLQDIVNGTVENTMGVPDARVIKPMSVEQSIMHRRVATNEPSLRMPPLARNLVDTEFTNVLASWINSLPITIDLPNGLAGTIGNTNTGSQSDNLWGAGSFINACRFQAVSNLTAAFMRAQVVGISGSYKCAIYADSAGSPAGLLGDTAEATGPGTGWQTFPMTPPLNLVGGSNYWLAIWSDDPSARTYYSGTGGTLVWGQYNYGTWPPVLATSGSGNLRYCILATSGVPPVFSATPADRTIGELTSLVVTNSATDADTPAQTLVYYLLKGPTNASIDPWGVITWTPTEMQGPSTNTFTTAVTDGVFSRSNNFLVVVGGTNHAPVAVADTLLRWPGQGGKVEAGVLVANDTDVDGDPISFVSAGPASAAGGVVSQQGVWVHYQPPVGYLSNDSFLYRIVDGQGGSNDGTVSVEVSLDAAPTENLQVFDLGGGTFRIRGRGVPLRTYQIQYSETQPEPTWQVLTSVQADASGAFEHLDAPPTNAPPREYRTVEPGTP